MDLIASDLNPQQQQAVMVGAGPTLVLAGPGSGKTRVLTRRVAYLIGYLGVRPYQILAVTFTNKAAREMEARVGELLGGETRGLTLGTFHAICARILRREAEQLPFDANFVIFDADDQLALVKQAVQELNLDDKRYRPPALHSAISAAKNELILPDTLPIQNYRDEVLRRVYQRYQELLLANNALDFDDLLLWAATLLENNPQVRERYARRYEHLLVDEFQDTNMAQYRLLKHLASFHNNIFVVGDADQSIYRWRGADYRNVMRFEKDFPDAQVILLEQNYRSTQPILDLAMAIIDRNPYRTPKRLFTDRGGGSRPVLFEAYDDRVEAAYAVETIASLVTRRQARPGDCAVMYRTNAQSRLIEEAFLAAGLPYRLVGAQRFYGRREVKDIVAYLRLVHNLSDDLSLTRIINVPARGIGSKTLLTLHGEAKAAGVSAGELLIRMAQQAAQSNDKHTALAPSLTGRARTALLQFGSWLESWVQAKDTLSPLALMDLVLQTTDYHTYIDDGSDEGHERWENVMELRRLAAEFGNGVAGAASESTGLTAFLERVALVSDQDTLLAQNNGAASEASDPARAVTLLTLHAAKGLEYPVVFITGLNDGTLPHSRSFDDPEAMMEERRLLYVGVTRARDRLYLTYAQNRSAYGYAEPAPPSRYLDDIPYELVEDASTGQGRGGGFHRRGSAGANRRTAESGKPAGTGYSRPESGRERVPTRPERWELPPPPGGGVRPTAEPRFRPGMHVVHPTWGEGLVLNSRLQDGDEILDVHFEQVGLKRLAASLARLEIIESKA